MGWWPCSILGSGPADVCRGNSNLHSNRHVCAHLWCLTCRGSKLRKSGAKSLHILCQVCVEVLGQLLLWYLQSLWLSISVKGTQPAPVLRPYLEWIMSLSEPHISVLKILCVCNEWSLYWHCSENVCTFVTQHVPIVKRGEATLECQCSSTREKGAGEGGSQCLSTFAWKGSIIGHQSSWASYLSYQTTWLDHWQGELPGWKVSCATATIYSSAMPICCPY